MTSAETFLDGDIALVAGQLPASATLLAELNRLQRADADLDETFAALRRHPQVLTEVLGAVNRSGYAGEVEIYSIEAAVARLGQRETFHLVAAVIWRQLCEPLRLYGVSADQLWVSGVFTALLMEQLAVPAGVDSRDALLAGLLRSIGKVVLERIARRTAEVPAYGDDEETLPEWETNLLGYANPDVSCALLDAWAFPTEVTAAIAEHYAPTATSAVGAHLLSIAATVADLHDRGVPAESALWHLAPPSLAACHLDAASVGAALEKANRTFDRISAALG